MHPFDPERSLSIDISIPGSSAEACYKTMTKLWVLVERKFCESNLDVEGLRLLCWLDEGFSTWAVTPASFLGRVAGPRE